MRLAAGVNIDPNNSGTSIDPARLCRSRAGKVDGRIFVVGFQETMDFASSISKVSHNKPFGIYVPSLCHIATGYVERHEAAVIDQVTVRLPVHVRVEAGDYAPICDSQVEFNQ